MTIALDTLNVAANRSSVAPLLFTGGVVGEVVTVAVEQNAEALQFASEELCDPVAALLREAAVERGRTLLEERPRALLRELAAYVHIDSAGWPAEGCPPPGSKMTLPLLAEIA